MANENDDMEDIMKEVLCYRYWENKKGPGELHIIIMKVYFIY